MTRLIAFGLGFLLSLPLPGAAQSEGEQDEVEAILKYDVAVRVGEGGVLTVEEEITVRALGDRIRRGIYRDFPTSFPRWAGLGRIEAPFRVLSVTRDGGPEPYGLESVGGPEGREGVRVRIGDPDAMLRPGIHEYVIAYETSRWVDFGEEVDRLYWNVTGNGWDFPIRSASARVSFEGTDARPDLESWTGPEGSTSSMATAVWDAATATAIFETTEGLAPREGLTVRLALPSGELAPPTEAQREGWFRLDWGGWIDGTWLVLLVLAVYLLMWRTVGMDPPSSSRGVREAPPEGYSPAALGFIEARGYDQSQLAAALVSLALKGAVRIEDEGTSWTVEKRAEPGELDEELSPEERALFDALTAGGDRVELAQRNHARLRSAIRSFRSTLTRRLEHAYFVNNRKWFAAGVAISVLGFTALAWRWRFDIDPVALFLCVWLTGWTAGVGTLVYRVYLAIRGARSGGGAALWAQAGFLSLFSVPFVGAEIGVTGLLLTMVPNHLVAAAVAVGGVNVVFYHLLERPTLKGRGVLDELDAFRAHLRSAGDHLRRTVSQVPAERLRTYERHLPHAIALGLEGEWTEAFRDALEPVLVGGAAAGALPWYRRHDDAAPMEASRFATALSAGLPSTLSSMSSPPSSSGGSSGGGFSGGGSSGGGGGGGGGGGW